MVMLIVALSRQASKGATISSCNDDDHGDHIFRVNDLFGENINKNNNSKDKKTSSLYFCNGDKATS